MKSVPVTAGSARWEVEKQQTNSNEQTTIEKMSLNLHFFSNDRLVCLVELTAVFCLFVTNALIAWVPGDKCGASFSRLQ